MRAGGRTFSHFQLDGLAASTYFLTSEPSCAQTSSQAAVRMQRYQTTTLTQLQAAEEGFSCRFLAEYVTCLLLLASRSSYPTLLTPSLAVIANSTLTRRWWSLVEEVCALLSATVASPDSDSSS